MAPRASDADIDQLVSQYLAAWNECDGERRMHHLKATWSESGVYEDPATQLAGLAELHAHIGRCQVLHVDCRVAVTADPVAHHGRFKLDWTLFDARDTEVLSGTDFGELDACGRIARLTAFVEPGTGQAPARRR